MEGRRIGLIKWIRKTIISIKSNKKDRIGDIIVFLWPIIKKTWHRKKYLPICPLIRTRMHPTTQILFTCTLHMDIRCPNIGILGMVRKRQIASLWGMSNKGRLKGVVIKEFGGRIIKGSLGQLLLLRRVNLMDYTKVSRVVHMQTRKNKTSQCSIHLGTPQRTTLGTIQQVTQGTLRQEATLDITLHLKTHTCHLNVRNTLHIYLQTWGFFPSRIQALI